MCQKRFSLFITRPVQRENENPLFVTQGLNKELGILEVMKQKVVKTKNLCLVKYVSGKRIDSGGAVQEYGSN